MLAMLAKRHPQSLVDGVADMLVCERHRSNAEMWYSNVVAQDRGAAQAQEVLQLMEAILEEPLPAGSCQYVQLSRRQLERLFRLHLHSTPSRFT